MLETQEPAGTEMVLTTVTLGEAVLALVTFMMAGLIPAEIDVAPSQTVAGEKGSTLTAVTSRLVPIWARLLKPLSGVAWRLLI